MKLILSRLLLCLCIGITGFAVGRMTAVSEVVVPAHQPASFSVRTTDSGIKVAHMEFISGSNPTEPEVGAIEYNGASLYLTTLTGDRVRIDTNDLNAVQGMQGPYLHHVYKLDSVTFDAYYFASGWTAYAKSGGYLKDTTLFVNYQRKPVCVSAAVQALIVAKYLKR